MNQLRVPLGLLEFLRKTYPDKLPREPLSEFEQGRLVGRQDVIDKINQLNEKEVRDHVRSQG